MRNQIKGKDGQKTDKGLLCETVCAMCGKENTRDNKMYCKECEARFCGECPYWNRYGCLKGHEGCTIDCKDFKRKEK